MLTRRRGPGTALLVALDLIFFGYVFWFRTRGISESFGLYGDQVRDWQIALKPFLDLPLVGPPSLAGGNTAGPVYYWILWLTARTIGPFCDWLPHAGGIGISLLQSGADVVFLHGARYALGSTTLAVAVALAIATAGPDAALSATIWNPPVGAALGKIALGLILLGATRNRAGFVASCAILWLAVQAHSTLLPVAAPVIAYLICSSGTWQPSPGSRRHAIARRAAVAALIVFALQTPWLGDRFWLHGLPSETPMGASVAAVARDPLHSIRLAESGWALVRALQFNLGLPMPPHLLAAALLAGGIAIVVRPASLTLRVIAIAPLLCAVVVYALWQLALTENYWYLALGPSAVLCLTAWMADSRETVRNGLAAVLLVLVIAAQPSQAQSAWHTLRTPAYGALVRGARETLRSGYAVHDVATTFPMPYGTDSAYIYGLLGGRLDRSAAQRVVIAPSGAIRFEAIEQ